MQAASIPAAEVQRVLAEVLARSELKQRESLLETFIRWLVPRLSTAEVHAFGNVLLGLLVASAVVSLAFLARRAWSLLRSPAPLAERADALTGVDARARLREHAAAAHAAAARGDLRTALRLYLHALLLALGGRGDLEWKAAWTNRELLRRGRPSLAALALLEPLVRELEPKEFGRAPVDERDVERLALLLAPHLALESVP